LSVHDVHPAMILAGPSQGVAVSGELYDLDLGQLQRVLEKNRPISASGWWNSREET
jgi:hypothetical protein